MNIIAALTLDALGREVERLPRYAEALRRACDDSPPPFGARRYGDLFRAAASDPYWMARALVTNAEREADGAGRLWSLSASTNDPSSRSLVKDHAVDESRHARWYIAILDLAFPDAADADLRAQLAGISPGYASHMEPVAIEGSPFAHELTLDDLVQMNIAEIRTSINHRLQAPVLLAYAPSERRARLSDLLARLLADEIRHVEYSATLIEQRTAGRLEDLIGLFTERLYEFNEITCAEVERSEFPLACSNDCRLSAIPPARASLALGN